MLFPNINKIALFVIFCAVITICSSCKMHADGSGSGQATAFDADSGFAPSTVRGTIESNEITESSGLAASRCRDDVLWTHNDSGDGPYIFALGRDGKHLGTWKVAGADNVDWEDIASRKTEDGSCDLYLAEIGNSKDGSRKVHLIYLLPEPAISDTAAASTREEPLSAGPALALKFSYPDRPHDAEAMMVHPTTGTVYIVSKERRGGASVFKLASGTAAVNTAEKVWDFSTDTFPSGMLTGGDISPDGRRVVIADYFAAYEFELPANAENFDDIWKQRPRVIEIGLRKQGEAVAYSNDGNTIIATSEGKNEPLIEATRVK